MKYLSTNTKIQENAIRDYFEREINAINRLNIKDISKAISAILQAYERDATIYIFGNGGSASTASHYAADFNKGISEYREKKFRFVCLSDNIPMLTAIANDISYDDIFRYPLVNYLKPTDLVIGISGSGNSKNVIRAVEYAKEIGAVVVGITGYNGGELKKIADYHMDANIDDMQISEDIHMIFDHMMYFLLNQ